MARLASKALAGYFKLPDSVVNWLPLLFDFSPAWNDDPYYGNYSFFDPCAGTGEAIVSLAESFTENLYRMGNRKEPRASIYACELEAGRAESLRTRIMGIDGYDENRCYHRARHGDAFTLNWDAIELSKNARYSQTSEGASVCLLNPPYDYDKTEKRAELKWLKHFTRAITPGTGILIYVVPHYTLGIAAECLVENYKDIHCLRFPDEDFENFQQCVVVAVRREAPLMFNVGDEPMIAEIQKWSDDSDSMPVLGSSDMPMGIVSLPPQGGGGFDNFVLAEMNIQAVYAHAAPWQYGSTQSLSWIDSTGLNRNVGEIMTATFPLAAPARPSHLAEALAAGILNTGKIHPNKNKLGLPAILIKGSYQKSHKSIQEKEKQAKKDGKDVTKIQFTVIQKPELRITILDTSTDTYHEIEAGSELSKAKTVGDMNHADILHYYSEALAEVMVKQCPPLHDPSNPEHWLYLPVPERPLWDAQENVAQTMIKLLARGDNGFILGEVGTGKTSIACGIVNALAPSSNPSIFAQLKNMELDASQLPTIQRALVLCPPHLLEDWQAEIKAVIPGARVLIITKPSDVSKVYEPMPESNEIGSELTIMLLTRETAKLGHAWGPAVATFQEDLMCPVCGEPISSKVKDLARKRMTCEHQRVIAPHFKSGDEKTENDVAKEAFQLAHLLMTCFPENNAVKNLTNGRYAKKLKQITLDIWVKATNEERKASLSANFKHKALVHGTIPLERTPYGKIIEWVMQKIETIMASERTHEAKRWIEPLQGLCFALPQPYRDEILTKMLPRIYEASKHDTSSYGTGSDLREDLDRFLFGFELNGSAQKEARQYLQSLELKSDYVWTKGYEEALEQITTDLLPKPVVVEEKKPRPYFSGYSSSGYSSQTYNSEKGHFTYRFKGDHEGNIIWTPSNYRELDNLIVGQPKTALVAMDALYREGEFYYSSRCPSYLFQASHLNLKTSSFKEHSKKANKIRQALVSLSDRKHLWETTWTNTETIVQKDAKAILKEKTIPQRGRVSLARFIRKHHPNSYDIIIIDEAHEYSNTTSAQSSAGGRLAEGKPTLILTGTLSNGYASPLFSSMWAFNPRFRDAFGRDDVDMFIDAYGYRRYVMEMLEDKARECDVEELIHGAFSDRVVSGTSTRRNGEAPGILPIFTLKHLLAVSATIHKEDLKGTVIPESSYHPIVLGTHKEGKKKYKKGFYTVPETEHTKALWAQYDRLECATIEDVKKNRFKKGLSGKLMGALAELPSYLDRATSDTGNQNGSGRYEIRYPESAGRLLVAAAKPIPASVIMPKEQWIIDTVNKEIKEGRNIIVTVWHKEVFSRIERLLKERYPEYVIALRSSRVGTRKRKTWIEEKVVKENKRILITNPVPISTGLNSLIFFNTIIWAENPQSKAIIFRQTNGRLIRPGHTEESVKDVRIFFPYYSKSTQVYGHQLLHEKVLASLRTDGLSAASTLGAMTGSDAISLQVGQAIFQQLSKKYEPVAA